MASVQPSILFYVTKVMFDDWWMSMHFIDFCVFSIWCLIIVAFLMVAIVWNNHYFDDWWCLIVLCSMVRSVPLSTLILLTKVIVDDRGLLACDYSFIWWLTVAVYFACSMVRWMQPSVPLLTTQASRTMSSRACSVLQAQSIPRVFTLPGRSWSRRSSCSAPATVGEVVQNLHISKIRPKKRVLDHADCTGPTRRHEPDQAWCKTGNRPALRG